MNRVEIVNGYMNTQEVCAYLQVHENTIFRWVKKGLLKAGRAGSEYRFKMEWVDRFAEGR